VVLGSGLSYGGFKSYVEKLMVWKSGSSGVGGGAHADHDCVIGVNANGDVVATMTLAEFAGYTPSPDSECDMGHELPSI
jgi:hypothetical protein